MDRTHQIFFALSITLIIGGFIGLNLMEESANPLSPSILSGNSITGLAVADLDQVNLNPISTTATSNDCWAHSSESSCEDNSNCQWTTDPWGSWCEPKECWIQWSQTSCEASNDSSSSNYINKTCIWYSAAETGWCEQAQCWSFSGSNESACVNNSQGIACNWGDEYDADNYQFPCFGPSERGCWEQTSESACTAIDGCSWGDCYEESCYEQSTKATCEAATGHNDNTCVWNSQYSYCSEAGCWDYTNQSSCEGNSCLWNNGYCSDYWCGDFSSTNQTDCENNTVNLECTWDNSSNFCQDKGCWNYENQNSCSNTTGCFWQSSSYAGWCQEQNCWNYDGSDADTCVNNTASLTCLWDSTGSWCYEDWTSKSCADASSEKECYDWGGCSWNNTASSCNDALSFGITNIGTGWNPSCYIFDLNETSCGNSQGCSYVSNQSGEACYSNTTIEVAGLQCEYFNESGLCNDIAALNTCCSWQAGSCIADNFTDNCWDEIDTPPEGAAFCEDYNAYTDDDLCEQIAGAPWYMPCKWNNATEHCEARLDKIFDSGRENVVYIDNKQSCEFAGGVWVTESYCEGDVAVPTGRCEQKFDEERNCNKECYACEYKTDGANWSSATKFKNACTGSKLGYCEYQADSSAPNSYGYCDVKDEFINGVASNCDQDCGSCTHMGDPNSAESTNKPSYHCTNSKADCKWIPSLDFPTDESKGRCATQSEKTCGDSCLKCDTENQCVQHGLKKGNSSLSALCSWSDTATVKCQPSTGADQMEFCFDGIDNNNDGKTDCADGMCFSDPFCGGGSIGVGQDCFGQSTQSGCEDTNTSAGSCVWINETWGSWCDIPGSNCWSYDGTNQTTCEDQGCSWHADSGGFCEEDWDNAVFDTCFAAANQSDCDAIANCTWDTMDWCSESGGFCDPDWTYEGDYYNCIQHDEDGEATCEAAGTADSNGVNPCNWYQDSWCESQGDSAGFCDHVKFSCWDHETQTVCENATFSDWCVWNSNEWGSWCESKTDGEDSCWNKNTNATCSDAGCSWISGFCDPPGFAATSFGGSGGGSGEGGGSSGSDGGYVGSGMSCYLYDGNQTGCDATTGCGWFSEGKPFCDVDFGANCPQYSYNGTICEQNDRCVFNNASSFCGDKVFDCFNHQNSSACGDDTHCLWQSEYNMCEPICFDSLNSQTACESYNLTGTNTSACRWINGWCGGAMAATYFKDMETGAPIPLGTDATGDAAPDSIDIVGHGMKDMGDAFGFGISVADMSQAAICNGVKLGAGGSAGSGSGKDTSKYFWYLDTDGVRTGSCAASHNSSAVGYEFYITFASSWSNSAGKATEQTTAYRCQDSAWVTTPIKVTAFKQKMCSEIGGGMVAVDKGDLSTYPDLYKSDQDIRVLVATANGTMNKTTPSDLASSGFVTPGAVDFSLDDLNMFKKSNKTNFGQDKGSKGYIEFNSDCWTATGCADYSCYNHPYCTANSLGVHASGFEDSRTPKIVAVSIEPYNDSALISYFTDKPSNGTLSFYHNDSSCSTVNATIHDRGITSSSIRAHRLAHVAEIYDDSGTNSLDYSLDADTIYYYKLQICDDNNKCGISKCTEFRTEPATDCAFCDFVTKIDVPSGWQVSYDVDQDLTYEHVQGQVCGTNAGMKSNNVEGRRTSILLAKTDNSSYIEFNGTRLTKTGLSRKIRDIQDASSLATGTTSATAGGTVGYAGMLSSTRDKIVNNLFPETCTIKIPSSGSCDALWHCNDALTTCVDRSSESTLLDTGSDYCIWKLPYCEFSTWAGGEPGSSTSASTSGSSSGGGGGGGGGAASTNNTGVSQSSDDKSQTTWVSLEPDQDIVMNVDSENIAISKISFNVNELTYGPYLKVLIKEEFPSSVGQAESKTYQRYQISTISTMNEENLENVELTFDVPKSWLSSNNIDSSHIAMYRFTDNNWVELQTYLTGESASSYTYTSETPGFSYFAIAYSDNIAENRIVIPESLEASEQQAETDSIEEESQAVDVSDLESQKGFKSNTDLLIIVLVITAIILIGLVSFIRYKRQED